VIDVFQRIGSESPKSRDAMHTKIGLLDAEAVFFLVRGAFT
jgi:hypothetical protein